MCCARKNRKSRNPSLHVQFTKYPLSGVFAEFGPFIEKFEMIFL